ncbi:MAG TPA: hypothetical protein VGH83_01075 [Candidatus Acidoferrum sp.]|jgi:hypothetical protein
MELKLRSTRTLKVTEARPTPEEFELLAQLSMDPRYDALVNVMERACIELDTGLVNVSTAEPEAVLGAHCVSKAAWLFFIYVQKQVLNAYHTRQGESGEPVEQPSLNDLLQGVG